jgi:hypothetical protein
MITPKIPLLKDGQILSVDVVNSIIKRTEYAGDLLKQYKLIAGNEMYVEPHYDGTRVSYLQPVGGGGTPEPVTLPYRIVGAYTLGGFERGFVYNGSTYTDIFVPGSFATVALGIDGLNIVGYYQIEGSNTRGFLYNGSTFTDIVNTSGATELSTVARGIDGSNIVGRYISGRFRGFLYSGLSFTEISPPSSILAFCYGIDGSNIVGQYNLGGSGRQDKGFLYNGSTFTDIIFPGGFSTGAFGIDGSNIVGYYYDAGYRGFLYNGSTYTTFSVPGSTYTVAYGIDGSNIVGVTAIDELTRGFLYNGSTFTDIFVPGSSGTEAYGIG